MVLTPAGARATPPCAEARAAWSPRASRRTSRTRPAPRRTARPGSGRRGPRSWWARRATGVSDEWRAGLTARRDPDAGPRRLPQRGRLGGGAAVRGAGGAGRGLRPVSHVPRFAAPDPAPYAGCDMHDAPDHTVYLDHAATTPMLPAAVEAMTAHLGDVGNPSSLHASGRAARRIVEESRETIAQALNCRPGEVVFTSGGTEADNLALKGLFWSRRDADPARVAHPGVVGRAPRRARRPALARPRRSTPRSSCSPSTRAAASTSTPTARPSSASPAPSRWSR